MRIAEMTWNEDEGGYEEYEDEAVGSVDWKEHADTILEIVDDQLAAFGLEIVQYDTTPTISCGVSKSALSIADHRGRSCRSTPSA